MFLFLVLLLSMMLVPSFPGFEQCVCACVRFFFEILALSWFGWPNDTSFPLRAPFYQNRGGGGGGPPCEGGGGR